MNDNTGAFFAVIIMLLLSFGLASFFAYFEMKEFNRCTGSDASFITALVSDLRILECK